MTGPVVAVDLGATRVVAAIDPVDGPAAPHRADRPAAALDPVDVPGSGDGSGGARVAAPAAVFAPGDGSALCVGVQARRRAAADPSRYEPAPRLRVDEDELLLGTRVVGVAEAWGAVLADVLDRAGPRLRGERPRALVLSHPAGWDRGRLEVLRRAGSGLARSLRLVPEPVAAAAHARWMRPRGAASPGPLAVLDLGARGASAAVLEPTGPAPGEVELLAHRDDDGFGGDDADELLLAHLLAGLADDPDADRVREVAAGATLADRRHRQVLLDDVRAARERLSEVEQAPVALPGRVVAAWLSRAELEDVLRPSLRALVAMLADTVAAAGTAPERLAGVWLTGGGARVPLLGALVHRELGVPATVSSEPRTVVAHGALVVARDLEPGPGGLGVLAAAAGRDGAPAGPATGPARPATGPFPVGPAVGPFPVGAASGPFPVAAAARSPVAGGPFPVGPTSGAFPAGLPAPDAAGARPGRVPREPDAYGVPPRDPDDTGEILDDSWDGHWDGHWGDDDDDVAGDRRPDRYDPYDSDRSGDGRGAAAPERGPSAAGAAPTAPGGRPGRRGRSRRRRIASALAVVALLLAAGGLALAFTRSGGSSPPAADVVEAWGHRFTVPEGWVRGRGDDAARRVVLRRPEAPRGVDLIAVQSGVLPRDLADDPVRARAQIADQFERARSAGDPVSGLEQLTSVAGRDATRYRQEVAPGVRLDWVVLVLGGDQVSVGCRHADDGGAGAALPRACEDVVSSLDAVAR